MSKLILSFNGQVVSEHELDKEQISIGRRPDNDIQIDNMAVSGHHARILTILNDSFLQDQNSTNGTHVNGVAVTKHALRNGDAIVIGQHTLTYQNESASDGGGDDFDRTMIIRPDAKGMPESDGNEAVDASVEKLSQQIAAESRTQAKQPLGQAKLRVINGANAGKELEIKKTLTTLGKPGVGIAVITRRAQGYFLVGVEGAGGDRPRVDGEPVGAQATRLEHEAKIEVAGVQMEFVLF